MKECIKQMWFFGTIWLVGFAATTVFLSKKTMLKLIPDYADIPSIVFALMNVVVSACGGIVAIAAFAVIVAVITVLLLLILVLFDKPEKSTIAC